VEQLSPEGGIIVAPVVHDEASRETEDFDKQLQVIQRDGDDHKIIRREDGYAFVPLLRDQA
jgi:hypothetical protein